MPSRYADTYSDRVALNILKHNQPNFKEYSYLDRGSDERQYCSPGIDLPIASIMRTKYGQYPEYHTSLDNLEFVCPAGLEGSLGIYKECIELIERNNKYRVRCLGEPQLGKRGLYPTLSMKGSGADVRDMMNFIAYADGKNDLLDISDIIGIPIRRMYPIIEKLLENDLLDV